MSILAREREFVTQNQPQPSNTQPSPQVWYEAPEEYASPVTYSPFSLSLTQQKALELYSQDLNVFPQPYGEKVGYAWKRLQTTRAYHNPEHPFHQYGLLAAFASRSNIAVMVGHTSRNLTVLENDESYLTDDLIRHFERLQIPIYGITSMKGVHLYVRTPYEMANISLNGIEVWGNSHFMLTDGSCIADQHGEVLHYYERFGKAVEIPTLTAEQVNDLAYCFSDSSILQPLTSAQKKRPRTTGLNKSTREYLEHGDQLRDTKKRRFFWAACDLAGNGLTREQVEAELIPIGQRSRPPIKCKVMNDAITSAFSRPRNVGRKIPEWKLAQVFIQQHPFTGTHNKIKRLTETFKALCRRAQIGTYTGTFRATLRDLAKISGLSLNTTRKAIKDLVEMGLIEHVTNDAASGGNCFRWGETILKLDTLTPFRGLTLAKSSVSSLRISIDVKEALGVSSVKVYEALCSTIHLLNLAEIVEKSGCPQGTVYRVLGKDSILVTSGLVTRVGRGQWQAQRADNATLEELVARPKGTLGKHQKRVERHAIDRAKYATFIVIKAREKDADPTRRAEFNKAYAAIESAWLKTHPKKPKGNPPKAAQVVEQSTAPDLLECPNCGQSYAAVFGVPDTCDYCNDLTTWKPIAPQVVELSPRSDKPTTKADARRLIDAEYHSAKNPIMAALRHETITKAESIELIKQIEAERIRKIAALAGIFV